MPQNNPFKVYVGSLAREVCQRDLERLFSEVGTIKLLEFKHGFAFIVSDLQEHVSQIFLVVSMYLPFKKIQEFERRDQAEDACRFVNLSLLCHFF